MAAQFLAIQGSGGTQVPYDRRNAPSTATDMAQTPEDSIRLRRYEEQWKFFVGIQWGFARESSDPLVTANYCRPIVNKKASFLVGKGIINEVPEPMLEITQPIIDEVWEYNNKQKFLMDLAITGGVTGDVFVLITYEPPSEVMKLINPYTEGKIRFRLLGSHQVFPFWDPLNHERLLFVRIVTKVTNGVREEDLDPNRVNTRTNNIGQHRERRFVEDIYPDRIVERWEGEEEARIRPNELGEIPLIHITNESIPGEYYGMSDLDGIIDLQREFNEKLTDVSDIINYHAAPITIISGARAKQLEKGPKALWSGLPKDAKVYHLELGGDLGASHNYIKFIREVMFDIGNLPEGSLGRMQAISNTSHSALQVQFQPLIEAIERKAPNYTRGIEQINYFILRYHQLVHNRMFPVDLCENCGGRIIVTDTTNEFGETIQSRRCYLVDPQTLEFLPPEKVELMWKRKHSFGIETRRMAFAQVKEDYLKTGTSYWDPGPMEDLEEKMAEQQERSTKMQQFQAEQVAKTTPAEVDPVTGAAKKAEPVEPPPTELQPEPEPKPEQLPPHDIDLPEEPETVEVRVQVWNPTKKQFEIRDMGEKRLVPSGCKRPRHLNPYKTKVKCRGALPRDKERDANLFATYQTNLWASRRWCQTHLDEEITPSVEDKQIADDIPFALAAKGMPDPTQQVAQTAGLQTSGGSAGSNNGAPPPPGPGPGRGNRVAPGDNLAQSPNAAAGRGV